MTQHKLVKETPSGQDKEFLTMKCSCGYSVFSGRIAAPIWFAEHLKHPDRRDENND